MALSAGVATAAAEVPRGVGPASLVVASGSQDRRLALWTARGPGGEICLGWRIGASTARPATFTCAPLGQERPVLTVEAGGGLGGQITWGVVVGLAGPAVAHLTVTQNDLGGPFVRRDLPLIPLKSRPGWHFFSTGITQRPAPELKALDGNGQRLVDDIGIWIHPPAGACDPCTAVPPPVNGQMPTPTGAPWSDTFARLGQGRSFDTTSAGPDADHAIALARAQPAVHAILAGHPAWLEATVAWATCNGRKLGWIVQFRFKRPATFTATLPVIRTSTGNFAYAAGVQRIAAARIRELDVSVDVTTGSVVGVDGRPYVDPTMSPGTWSLIETIAPFRDGGGPDDPAPCSHD